MGSLLATFLALLLVPDAFEAGDVGHVVGVLALLKAFSRRRCKLVGQGHQPVDQAQEFQDFIVGVAGVERADRLLQAQVVEAIGLLTVALSGQMGGDEELGAVVGMARQVELFLDVEVLSEGRSELEVASGELDTVGVGARGLVRISLDGESHQWHGKPLADAVQVVVEPPGQVGVALHLLFKMDEKPLLAAIELADLDELVGAQRAADGIGDEGAELLLERGGVDSPVDERSDRRKGEFPEGPKELVEGFLPRAVVVDDIGHPTQAFACRWLILQGDLENPDPAIWLASSARNGPPFAASEGPPRAVAFRSGLRPSLHSNFSAENFC